MIEYFIVLLKRVLIQHEEIQLSMLETTCLYHFMIIWHFSLNDKNVDPQSSEHL